MVWAVRIKRKYNATDQVVEKNARSVEEADQQSRPRGNVKGTIEQNVTAFPDDEATEENEQQEGTPSCLSGTRAKSHCYPYQHWRSTSVFFHLDLLESHLPNGAGTPGEPRKGAAV